MTKRIWDERFEDIRAFERYATRNGIAIRKFFLHVSRKERSDYAPWYVVPANHKWFTRLVVVAAVIDALEEMQLTFPKVNRDKRKELAAVRKRLEDERGR